MIAKWNSCTNIHVSAPNIDQALGLRDIGYIVIYPTDMNVNKFGADMDYLPTLDDAIRWLREAKGVHVATSTNEHQSEWICHLQVKGQYAPISVIDEINPSKSHDLA